VTIELNRAAGTPDIAGDGEWAAVGAAFDFWDNVLQSRIDFIDVSDGLRGNEDIYFGGWRAPPWDPGYWDRNPNALGATWAFYPFAPLSHMEIYLNDRFAWGLGSNYDVRSVAIHEIGHALGFGHSDDPTSVMYPVYTGIIGDRLTSPDDIALIQASYGVTYTTENPTQQQPAPVPATLGVLVLGWLIGHWASRRRVGTGG
jgi:hypothetical protein